LQNTRTAVACLAGGAGASRDSRNLLEEAPIATEAAIIRRGEGLCAD